MIALLLTAWLLGPTHGSIGDQDGHAYAMELADDDIKLRGQPWTPDQALKLGQNVCQQRAGGRSEKDLIEDGVTAGFPRQVSVDVVTGAEFHFCPAYRGSES